MLTVDIKDWQAFVAGFVVLSILFRIPFAGPVLLIVTTSLGFGALIYTVHDNWEVITGTIG